MPKEYLILTPGRQRRAYIEYNQRNNAVVDTVFELTKHKEEQELSGEYWKKVIVFMGHESWTQASRSTLVGVSLRSPHSKSPELTGPYQGSRAEFAEATVPTDMVSIYMSDPHLLHQEGQAFVKLRDPIPSYRRNFDIPGYIRELDYEINNRTRFEETGRNIELLEECLQSVQAAISIYGVDTFKEPSF